MRTRRADTPGDPLLDAIASAPEVRELAAALDSGEPVAAVGAAGSSTSFVAAAVARRTGRPVLLVFAHPDDADEAADELTTHGVRAERFPALELTPGETLVSLDLFAERLRVARSARSDPPETLTAPIHALMQRLPAPGAEADMMRTLARGDTLDPADLARWLDSAGYRRAETIEEVGEFAVRGGILDIFPPTASAGDPVPIRLDFFGDELDSIHEIDPATMASDRAIPAVELIGARLRTATDETTGAPLTRALGSRWLAVIVDPVEVTEQARGYYERVLDAAEIVSPPNTLRGLREDLGAVAEVSQYTAPAPGGARALELPASNLPPFAADAREAIHDLVELARRARVTVPCQNQGEMDRLRELLGSHEAGARVQARLGYLHRGFIWDGAEPLAFVPHHELLHRFLLRRKPARLRSGRSLDAFIDLGPGDLAVHADHGLCRFLGLRVMARRASDRANGAARHAHAEEEFLSLQFAKNTTLHVPVSQIDKVQRYIGGFRGKPPLSSLGSTRWRAQMEKVSDAVHDLAGELLRVQAARAATPGVRHPADTAWQKEFEAEFPYEETEDQLAALADIKRDMQTPRPMDRLLCGDVGFGKTELAIRAAFKAAEFGKQVAVLVPTTVLAEQHERTFRDRFADYPFRIESLSRFKTTAEQRTILNELAAGRVDIVIGTHRLLSKDVSFKDLGLVVIDEEQRFGVEHKQKLLSLRITVDVLTLSATPIPRTLHLSLLGLRDISSLSMAPADRRSVVTEVIPFQRDRIRRALARELARGGQTFFVHNRVRSIHRVADEVRRLAPEARVVVGHGQMPAAELERVMLAFIRRQADILVCTTIIESGVDIPSANTMIITDADRFGLADLHQLRGRVGRSAHRAYCTLLLPETRAITEVATRRLKAIEEFSMLGAGFKIAMRDLEIRGAGDILGAEQSGHIATVGYEMYCRLLEDAVHRLKNEPADPIPAQTIIDIGLTGMIPASYIPSVKRRIEAYRRIAQARSSEEIDRTERDMRGAYGDPPRATQRLLGLADLRVLSARMGVRSIAVDGQDVVFKTGAPAAIAEALRGARGTVRLIAPTHPGAPTDAYYRPPKNHLEPATLLNILRHRLGAREPAQAASV